MVRFPVQLLEAVCNLVLSGILWILFWKRKNDFRFRGRLLHIYMIVYGIIRFTDEFLRGDAIRGHIWIFSTSQWISIGMIVIGSILWTISWQGKTKYKKTIS